MNPKIQQAATYLKSVRDVAQLLLAGDRFDFKSMNPSIASVNSLDGVYSYLPKIAQSKNAAAEVLGKSSPEFLKSSDDMVRMLNALKNNWPTTHSDVQDAAKNVQSSSKKAWHTVLTEKSRSMKAASVTESSNNQDFSDSSDMNHAPQPK